jgi:MSHA biogenesis protein MshM
MGITQLARFSTVLEHYGFAREPFGDSPDPGLFYPATSHVKVLDSLTHGIKEGAFLQAVTSGPGAGKTTILKLLIDHLAGSEVILHRQPKLSSNLSLKYLLTRLGAPAGGQSVESLRDELIETANRKRIEGAPVVLLIDDAHTLREDTLAILRSLCPKQSNNQASLQVILAAVEGSAPNLEELCREDSRCSAYHLQPLSRDEAGAFIAHRLSLSGYKGPPLFSQNSVSLIAEFSAGCPREINTLCSEALRLSIEGGGSGTLDDHCVRQAIGLRRVSYASEPARDFDINPRISLSVGEPRLPEPTILIEDLERWFLRYQHSWSGTVAELLLELQEEAETRYGSGGSCHDPYLLLSTLKEHSSKLAGVGIEFSITTIESYLRVVTLRRAASQSTSENKLNETANADPMGRGGDEHGQSGVLSPEGTMYESASTQPMRTHDRPTTISSSANEDAHEKENKSAAKDHGGLFRAAMLLLIVATLAAIPLFWVRRGLIIDASAKRLSSELETERPWTRSGNPQVSVQGLLQMAQTGDSASQLALAKLYQSGEGVQKDDTKAFYWLREAAAKGQAEAAYDLAVAYEVGQGVPLSKVDAYCWYVLASEAGYATSEQQIKALTPQLSDAEIAAVRYRLGEMHLRGEGTDADLIAAYFWFRLAEVAGNPAAKQAKESLIARMDRGQIVTASAKASKWLQAHSPKAGTDQR